MKMCSDRHNGECSLILDGGLPDTRATCTQMEGRFYISMSNRKNCFVGIRIFLSRISNIYSYRMSNSIPDIKSK